MDISSKNTGSKKMNEIIISIFYATSGGDFEAPLLATSIRKFGGKLSRVPIWVILPSSENKLPEKVKTHFKSLNVELKYFDLEDDEKNFPFISFVKGAAAAEKMAIKKSKRLVWLDSAALFFNEPKEFLIDEGIKLGYRPVHHTLIGSIYDEPIDTFWKIVYSKCNVPEENIFPMQTHVDGKVLRPYFNSGCLVVRPEEGILQKWWEKFKEIYREPELTGFYKKDSMYTVFIHQTILIGVILSNIKKQYLQEFSFDYNYPLNLYNESSEKYKPKDLHKLISARTCSHLQKPEWIENLPIRDPLKTWIKNQVIYFSQDIDPTELKVKMGQVPLIYPIPIALVGSLVSGKPNFETIGDVGIMGINPPLVYVSSHQDHYTNKGIIEHNTLSINFPSRELLSVTDLCGKASGKDMDKSELFNVFYGDLQNAPMIVNCSVNLEVEVIKEFSIEHRQIFIGKVRQSYVNKEYIKEVESKNRIEGMRYLDPIIYALDNKYYSIGEEIGTGYNESEIKK